MGPGDAVLGQEQVTGYRWLWVAWIVAFLCSPKAVAINGDAVVVGGGIRGAIHY